MCECVFCQINRKESPAHIIYENEYASVVLDIAPIKEGHVLILPKHHVDSIDQLTEEELVAVMKIAQKMVKALRNTYHADGYSIMQNGEQFCNFGHCHIHIFPRYQGDGFGWNDPKEQSEYSDCVAEKIKNQYMKL